MVKTRKQIEVEEKEVIRRERCYLCFSSLFVVVVVVVVFVCLMFDETGGEAGDLKGKVNKPSTRGLVSLVCLCICVFVQL